MNEEVKIDGNLDINKALEEFETKSTQVQAPKAVETSQVSDVPKIVQLVMKFSGGAIKDQRQAEYVLLGCILIMFALSVYFFFFSGRSKTTPVPININASDSTSFAPP